MGVYGPTTREGRNLLWENLGAVRGLWEGSWRIGGDLNATQLPNERNIEGRISNYMRRFSQIIDELKLKDISLQGGPIHVEMGA